MLWWEKSDRPSASRTMCASPYLIMSGEQSSRHSDNDDSFHNYKNLLHQENFVQNANFYAGGKRNNVIILRNECKGKEKLFGMRVQIIHSSFMPRTMVTMHFCKDTPSI